MELIVDCFAEYINLSPRVVFKFNAVAVDVQVHCPRIGVFIVIKSIDGEHRCCLVVERMSLVLRVIRSNHALEDDGWAED